MHTAKKLLVIVAAVGGLSFLGGGCKSGEEANPGAMGSEQPKAEHPQGEHPKGEHPQGEHPQGEHPKF